MPFSALAPTLSLAVPEPRSLALLAAAYAIGSVSGSLTLGKLRGVDIRTQGSGNAGGTNALRTQGLRFALGVVAIDIGKGALAAWLALRYAPLGDGLSVTAHGYLAAFAAVLGHVWPLWHGFRGGKGVATVVGGLAVLWPFAIPVLLLVWGTTLVVSGYVGLASVVAALCLPLLAWLSDAGAPRLWFCVAAAALVAFTHRGNLARLRAGTESRFARARLLHRWRKG
ncbi:glycerol-3-phosphate 1-O-acyltransferase PlsY [Lysobacter enzymogenes]|uniref:glycerol-3-phosphate 1-O-acyltransferase PlsY n=1 Tax=Lysobacter enzymogenes TaxID=69 RepID=UPI001A966985|nr:glycerol-3-phosphate 1-O-acyltransferase PlsY [Lysobacter enzymogenes]QQP98697.1 glycerol-3-phosphate 1-O-acyltransferase PlsY [Lysobacter enzymogenes]